MDRWVVDNEKMSGFTHGTWVEDKSVDRSRTSKGRHCLVDGHMECG